MASQEVAQVVMDASAITTIINNVNSLYSTAISQFTSYTLGVVALVGVLIPALVTVIQVRSLKAEKESLEKYISDEVNKAKLVIKEEMLQEIKRQIQSEENELTFRLEEKFSNFEKKLECAQASSFHIQGNGHLSRDMPAMAAEDFCDATHGYLDGGDELNGQRTLRMLIEDCLPKMYESDFEDVEIDKKIDDLIVLLKEHNNNNRYLDQIDRLNKARKTAKSRKK